MEQKIIVSENNYTALTQWMNKNKCRKVFLVCDKSLSFLKINDYFNTLNHKINIIRFDDFSPNPLYESIVKGVAIFRKENCDSIIAVGGGSTIDVAKCIKLYSHMDDKTLYLKQEIIPNTIPFLAIPTTAGTGSESTRYAVVYYHGEKQSISDNSCLPETVLLDSSVLQTLPLYQKKSTMLDAFCHAIESYWSINSTTESKVYSKQAIQMILANKDGYLANIKEANEHMLFAANIAGKAINITQTTAGHAMCYKITSLFGLAHGHAAALCNRKLFPWMINHLDECIDPRGKTYLKTVFNQLADTMGCDNPKHASEKIENFFDSLKLSVPKASEKDYEILRTSVNPVRLKNHPIYLDMDTIDKLYHQILSD